MVVGVGFFGAAGGAGAAGAGAGCGAAGAGAGAGLGCAGAGALPGSAGAGAASEPLSGVGSVSTVVVSSVTLVVVSCWVVELAEVSESVSDLPQPTSTALSVTATTSSAIRLMGLRTLTSDDDDCVYIYLVSRAACHREHRLRAPHVISTALRVVTVVEVDDQSASARTRRIWSSRLRFAAAIGWRLTSWPTSKRFRPWLSSMTAPTSVRTNAAPR